MKKEKELVINVATDISKIGGIVYYVGGYVRDMYLGKENKDIDVEIHGITLNQLKSVLSNYGEVIEVGASFGVLKVKDFDIDFTMPRTENKTGEGHKEFNVEVKPFLGTLNASKRRDFSMNSLLLNVLNNELVDHFNGIEALNNKEIIHVDKDTFIEDPLRVFRACQFASRFNFSINLNTHKLCSTIDISSLSKERVYEETKKAICKSSKPSIYFCLLKSMNHLSPFFNELDELSQPVFKYIMKAIDNLEYPTIETVYSVFGLYTDIDNLFLRISNGNKLLKKIKNNIDIINIVKNTDMSSENYRKVAYFAKDDISTINNFVDFFVNMNFIESKSEFLNKFNIALEEIKIPLIKGTDIFEMGIKPGREFGELIKYAMLLQIKGLTKTEIQSELLNQIS